MRLFIFTIDNEVSRQNLFAENGGRKPSKVSVIAKMLKGEE